MKLLTFSNPKTLKGEAAGYLTAILHLSPANLSGYEVCQWRTKGCTAGCLNTAGRGGMFREGGTNAIQEARKARTKMLFEHWADFAIQLRLELRSMERKAARLGLKPAVRLNGTSDLPWETYNFMGSQNIFEAFPRIMFYDYTKSHGRSFRHAIG